MDINYIFVLEFYVIITEVKIKLSVLLNIIYKDMCVASRPLHKPYQGCLGVYNSCLNSVPYYKYSATGIIGTSTAGLATTTMIDWIPGTVPITNRMNGNTKDWLI